MKSLFSAVCFGLALPWAGLHGQTVRFTSGTRQVSLIELFTSEGCSSCPPAERWLGALKNDPGLWRDFVPVSFHVDYWDNLGWLDRFATPAFTQREYAYAASWGTSSVYTPCFVRDGAEWKPDAAWASSPRANEDTGGKPVPRNQLTVEIDGSGRGEVEFTPMTPSSEGQAATFAAHLALLGGGFSSRVTAGENSGETLRHEFVALAVVDRTLVPAADGMVFRADFTLPPPAVSGAQRQAIAVWVTRPGSLASIQATGGWLSR